MLKISLSQIIYLLKEEFQRTTLIESQKKFQEMIIHNQQDKTSKNNSESHPFKCHCKSKK